jgi:hypothetical protein
MKTDRELLELAAKAAGIQLRWIQGPDDDECIHPIRRRADGMGEEDWSPLEDHDQAKNLRHLLKMTTGYDDRFTSFGACAYATYATGTDSFDSIMQNIEEAGGKKKALRRAIVRAAAAIGKGMQ